MVPASEGLAHVCTGVSSIADGMAWRSRAERALCGCETGYDLGECLLKVAYKLSGYEDSRDWRCFLPAHETPSGSVGL